MTTDLKPHMLLPRHHYGSPQQPGKPAVLPDLVQDLIQQQHQQQPNNLLRAAKQGQKDQLEDLKKDSKPDHKNNQQKFQQFQNSMLGVNVKVRVLPTKREISSTMASTHASQNQTGGKPKVQRAVSQGRPRIKERKPSNVVELGLDQLGWLGQPGLQQMQFADRLGESRRTSRSRAGATGSKRRQDLDSFPATTGLRRTRERKQKSTLRSDSNEKLQRNTSCTRNADNFSPSDKYRYATTGRRQNISIDVKEANANNEGGAQTNGKSIFPGIVSFATNHTLEPNEKHLNEIQKILDKHTPRLKNEVNRITRADIMNFKETRFKAHDLDDQTNNASNFSNFENQSKVDVHLGQPPNNTQALSVHNRRAQTQGIKFRKQLNTQLYKSGKRSNNIDPKESQGADLQSEMQAKTSEEATTQKVGTQSNNDPSYFKAGSELSSAMQMGITQPNYDNHSNHNIKVKDFLRDSVKGDADSIGKHENQKRNLQVQVTARQEGAEPSQRTVIKNENSNERPQEEQHDTARRDEPGTLGQDCSPKPPSKAHGEQANTLRNSQHDEAPENVNVSTEQPSFLTGWHQNAEDYIDGTNTISFDERHRLYTQSNLKSIQMLSQNIDFKFDHFRVAKEKPKEQNGKDAKKGYKKQRRNIHAIIMQGHETQDRDESPIGIEQFLQAQTPGQISIQGQGYQNDINQYIAKDQSIYARSNQYDGTPGGSSPGTPSNNKNSNIDPRPSGRSKSQIYSTNKQRQVTKQSSFMKKIQNPRNAIRAFHTGVKSTFRGASIFGVANHSVLHGPKNQDLAHIQANDVLVSTIGQDGDSSQNEQKQGLSQKYASTGQVQSDGMGPKFTMESLKNKVTTKEIQLNLKNMNSHKSRHAQSVGRKQKRIRKQNNIKYAKEMGNDYNDQQMSNQDVLTLSYQSPQKQDSQAYCPFNQNFTRTDHMQNQIFLSPDIQVNQRPPQSLLASPTIHNNNQRAGHSAQIPPQSETEPTAALDDNVAKLNTNMTQSSNLYKECESIDPRTSTLCHEPIKHSPPKQKPEELKIQDMVFEQVDDEKWPKTTNAAEQAQTIANAKNQAQAPLQTSKHGAKAIPIAATQHQQPTPASCDATKPKDCNTTNMAGQTGNHGRITQAVAESPASKTTAQNKRDAREARDARQPSQDDKGSQNYSQSNTNAGQTARMCSKINLESKYKQQSSIEEMGHIVGSYEINQNSPLHPQQMDAHPDKRQADIDRPTNTRPIGPQEALKNGAVNVNSSEVQYVLCNQVIKKQRKSQQLETHNFALNEEKLKIYQTDNLTNSNADDISLQPRLSFRGKRQDILNIKTDQNVVESMSKQEPNGSHRARGRSKTPQVSHPAGRTDAQLRKQHFDFLSRFESKKDAYLQNFYESQKRIQLRNHLLLLRQRALENQHQQTQQKLAATMAEALQSVASAPDAQIPHPNNSMITIKKYEEIDRIQKTLKLDPHAQQKYQSQALTPLNHHHGPSHPGSNNANPDIQNYLEMQQMQIKNTFNQLEQNELFQESHGQSHLSSQGEKMSMQQAFETQIGLYESMKNSNHSQRAANTSNNNDYQQWVGNQDLPSMNQSVPSRRSAKSSSGSGEQAQANARRMVSRQKLKPSIIGLDLGESSNIYPKKQQQNYNTQPYLENLERTHSNVSNNYHSQSNNSMNQQEVIAKNDLALGALGSVLLENYDTSKSEQSPRRDGDKPCKKNERSIKPAIANTRQVANRQRIEQEPMSNPTLIVIDQDFNILGAQQITGNQLNQNEIQNIAAWKDSNQLMIHSPLSGSGSTIVQQEGNAILDKNLLSKQNVTLISKLNQQNADDKEHKFRQIIIQRQSQQLEENNHQDQQAKPSDAIKVYKRDSEASLVRKVVIEEPNNQGYINKDGSNTQEVKIRHIQLQKFPKSLIFNSSRNDNQENVKNSPAGIQNEILNQQQQRGAQGQLNDYGGLQEQLARNANQELKKAKKKGSKRNCNPRNRPTRSPYSQESAEASATSSRANNFPPSTVRSSCRVPQMELKGQQMGGASCQYQLDMLGSLGSQLNAGHAEGSIYTKSGAAQVNFSGFVNSMGLQQTGTGKSRHSSMQSRKSRANSKNQLSSVGDGVGSKPQSPKNTQRKKVGQLEFETQKEVNTLQEDWIHRNVLMQQINTMHQAMLSDETRERNERMYKEQIEKNYRKAIEKYASNAGIDSKGRLIPAGPQNEQADPKLKSSGVGQTMEKDLAEMDKQVLQKYRLGSQGGSQFSNLEGNNFSEESQNAINRISKIRQSESFQPRRAKDSQSFSFDKKQEKELLDQITHMNENLEMNAIQVQINKNKEYQKELRQKIMEMKGKQAIQAQVYRFSPVDSIESADSEPDHKNDSKNAKAPKQSRQVDILSNFYKITQLRKYIRSKQGNFILIPEINESSIQKQETLQGRLKFQGMRSRTSSPGREPQTAEDQLNNDLRIMLAGYDKSKNKANPSGGGANPFPLRAHTVNPGGLDRRQYGMRGTISDNEHHKATPQILLSNQAPHRVPEAVTANRNGSPTLSTPKSNLLTSQQSQKDQPIQQNESLKKEKTQQNTDQSAQKQPRLEVNRPSYGIQAYNMIINKDQLNEKKLVNLQNLINMPENQDKILIISAVNAPAQNTQNEPKNPKLGKNTSEQNIHEGSAPYVGFNNSEQAATPKQSIHIYKSNQVNKSKQQTFTEFGSFDGTTPGANRSGASKSGQLAAVVSKSGNFGAAAGSKSGHLGGANATIAAVESERTVNGSKVNIFSVPPPQTANAAPDQAVADNTYKRAIKAKPKESQPQPRRQSSMQQRSPNQSRSPGLVSQKKKYHGGLSNIARSGAGSGLGPAGFGGFVLSQKHNQSRLKNQGEGLIGLKFGQQLLSSPGKLHQYLKQVQKSDPQNYEQIYKLLQPGYLSFAQNPPLNHQMMLIQNYQGISEGRKNIKEHSRSISPWQSGSRSSYYNNNIVKAGGFTQGLNKQLNKQQATSKTVGLTIDMNNILNSVEAAKSSSQRGGSFKPSRQIQDNNQTARQPMSPISHMSPPSRLSRRAHRAVNDHDSQRESYPPLEVHGFGCELIDQQDFLDNLKEFTRLNGLIDESQQAFVEAVNASKLQSANHYLTSVRRKAAASQDSRSQKSDIQTQRKVPSLSPTKLWSPAEEYGESGQRDGQAFNNRKDVSTNDNLGFRTPDQLHQKLQVQAIESKVQVSKVVKIKKQKSNQQLHDEHDLNGRDQLSVRGKSIVPAAPCPIGSHRSQRASLGISAAAKTSTRVPSLNLQQVKSKSEKEDTVSGARGGPEVGADDAGVLKDRNTQITDDLDHMMTVCMNQKEQDSDVPSGVEECDAAAMTHEGDQQLRSHYTAKIRGAHQDGEATLYPDIQIRNKPRQLNDSSKAANVTSKFEEKDIDGEEH